MDKQQKILSAAIKLFVQYGFHGTPTSSIAKKAGVANGTLFHYYKTKDELITSLYIVVKEKLAQKLKAIIENETNLEIIFKKLIIGSFYWAIDNQIEFSFIQLFQASPYHAMISKEVIDNQMKPYVELVESGIKANILRPISVELICILLNSHIAGIFQYLATKKISENEQKSTLEEAYSMLWKMVT